VLLSALKSLSIELDRLTVDKHGLDRSDFYTGVADLLLNKYVIYSGERKYRICEIEFYHYNEQSYPDPYAHRDPLQKDTLGQWYCHRSGLDITFGSGRSYNGILLRAILELENPEYIYGPINLRKKLFRGVNSVMEKEGFYLAEAILTNETVNSARRFGINKQKDTMGFHDLKHRYYILPHLKHPKV
jgi:hypothetical protein